MKAMSRKVCALVFRATIAVVTFGVLLNGASRLLHIQPQPYYAMLASNAVAAQIEKQTTVGVTDGTVRSRNARR